MEKKDFWTENSCPWLNAGYEEPRAASANKTKSREIDEKFSTTFDCHKAPSSSFFYSMGGHERVFLLLGERGMAEVLSVVRNKRMCWCCHCGCHQISALLHACFVAIWKGG
jgi:hypothetical protein